MTLRPMGEGLALLQIANPERPYLGEDLPEELSELLRAPGPEIRGIVMASSGDYFSAGAARESLLKGRATSYAARVPEAVLSCPVPVVAALEGHAIGGGLSLGLLADVAFFADRSLYGANFVALGFSPGMGSTVLLAESFGAPLAREMLLGGRMFTGSELAERGVANVWPKEEVYERAVRCAAEMTEAPPLTSRALKRSLAQRRLAAMRAAIEEEQAMHAEQFSDDSTISSISERYGR